MRIHSYESLAALDGEGLRYGVFLSGCPLRCAYCHNPDTWCETGEEKSVDELLSKLRRYKPYFIAGGGGVTFSGGEPLLQAKELRELGKKLGEIGIGYAIDTSGHVDLTEDVKEVLDGASLILLDLKFADAESFRRYTGGDFSRVKAFFEFLKNRNTKLWIRTVIVPTINDTKDALMPYLDFLSPYKNRITRYELLGFHTMGFFKYEKLGIENPFKNIEPLDKEKLKELQDFVNKELHF